MPALAVYPSRRRGFDTRPYTAEAMRASRDAFRNAALEWRRAEAEDEREIATLYLDSIGGE